MPRTSLPRVAYAFVADVHKVADIGKTDAFGIIDKFLVWATPTVREFPLIVRIDQPTGGESHIARCLAHGPGKRLSHLPNFHFASVGPMRTTLSATRLRLNLGDRAISAWHRVQPGGGSRIHPLAPSLGRVAALASASYWREAQALLEDPQSIKALALACGARSVGVPLLLACILTQVQSCRVVSGFLYPEPHWQSKHLSMLTLVDPPCGASCTEHATHGPRHPTRMMSREYNTVPDSDDPQGCHPGENDYACSKATPPLCPTGVD